VTITSKEVMQRGFLMVGYLAFRADPKNPFGDGYIDFKWGYSDRFLVFAVYPFQVTVH
jgi:hypothetical protein